MAKKEDKKITVIDANVEGREKAIAEAIRQIDKKYGEGAIMRLGSAPLKEVDVIPTGALCIDIALGIGGIPRGRVTEIYGPESSGKTTGFAPHHRRGAKTRRRGCVYRRGARA